jgi:hypothetical protein
MQNKSRNILKALAAGRSCQQLLARDRTLTSHDIFRAAAEAPTKFWKKDPKGKAVEAWPKSGDSSQKPAKQGID